jgi:Uma2 family endonuclease
MRAGQIDLLDLELPIVLRPSAHVSDDDLLRFSEQNRPYRIERNRDGEITIMTPVNYRGGTYEGFMPANVGFKLPDGSCLAPDAAWLTKEHEDALTPEEQDSFPPVCPDFLIEVRSKSDSRRIVEAKMQIWIENGAQLAWLVDPIDQNVTIYRPGEGPELLDRPQVVSGTDPVDGFELRCSRLWPPR